MRVLVRFASKTDVVENVSVDDKCLPIVAGIHPYASSSRDTSPLAREAPLWFKTLALEAIYIDCSRRYCGFVFVVSCQFPLRLCTVSIYQVKMTHVFVSLTHAILQVLFYCTCS